MSRPVITRHFEATQVNAVLNHPAVHPWVCGNITGPLDIGPALADRRNILLMGEHGGILFHHLQAGLYEAHTQVVPEGRGEWCLAMTEAALRWMFTRTDCIEVVTRVPKGNLAARALTKAAGLTFQFTNPHGWALAGKVVSADVFGLTIQDWIRRAPGLVERGRDARVNLEREARSVFIGFADDANDRQLGAAFGMISGGQPEKGVVFFNRWAAMTDQPKFKMLGRKPLAFDMQGLLLVFRPGGEFFAVRAAS